MSNKTKYVDIVFDGPPSHESGRFIETENDIGHSIGIGEWVQRLDGYWVLRIWQDMHYHVTKIGDDFDTCDRCGHNIRHPIHSMSSLEYK